MKRLVVDEDKRVGPWIAERLDEPLPECFRTIGLEENGNLIAAVLYESFFPEFCLIHVAASPCKRWMTKDMLRITFLYPFRQLGLKKLYGPVRVSNTQAQRFDEHLGFIREQVIPKGYKGKEDLIIYSMTADQCRFI